MSSEWYCKIMGDQWGPMSSQELMAVANRGRLTRDDVVRKGATGTWVRAEMVNGLFNSAPPAETATTGRVAVSGRMPLPARRSVREVHIRQYWVKVSGQTAGPFSGPRLQKLAVKGKLKPHYLVSEDLVHWVRASSMEGLFGEDSISQSPTTSVRSTIWPLPQPEESNESTDSPPSEETRLEAGSLLLAHAGAANS